MIKNCKLKEILHVKMINFKELQLSLLIEKILMTKIKKVQLLKV